ncbi:MAG: hypothetical protein ACI93N_000322 [Flavobacteriaceae bacterium]|jgi:hypothetical protein
MNFRIFICILLFSVSFLTSCAQKETKINGVSFVASRDTLVQNHINPILSLNSNYAAIMPFGFIKNLEHPEIIYNTDRQWFGETNSGAKQYINKLQENNVKIMLKPQIWIWRGEFTGNLKMNSEEDWKSLEDSYRVFILGFAKLAMETQVDLFCLGTELEQFIIHRPEFWIQLISEVKDIYKGKLTYAANWDEYKRVPFWSELDYIGIDGYFPVSESKTPTIDEAKEGWKQWKNEMQTLSISVNRKILFTEFGYRSINFSGKEPWNSDHTLKGVNLEAQSNLFNALFEELWNEEWFAGGYLWKWFIDHEEVGGFENHMFTPQNKPVESVIRTNYSMNN